MHGNLTLPERVLRRDMAITVASLVGLTALAWLYLVILASDMQGGDMRLMGLNTPGAMSGPMPWNLSTCILMAVMWFVMMVGMMIPSASPMILLFARVQRTNLPHENPLLRITLFTLAYLLLWLGFSIAATGLQWLLGELGLLSQMMKTNSPRIGAVIFAVAGLYQLTPLKRACLEKCQSPLQFLTRYWHKGNTGAFRMGIYHGLYCLGCCWCLMLLLFAGGVMNLLWVATIAILVLVEKLLPAGRLNLRISGAALLCIALYLAING